MTAPAQQPQSPEQVLAWLDSHSAAQRKHRLQLRPKWSRIGGDDPTLVEAAATLIRTQAAEIVRLRGEVFDDDEMAAISRLAQKVLHSRQNVGRTITDDASVVADIIARHSPQPTKEGARP